MNTKNIIYWLARLLAAGIMLQTLYFKFTGAPESVEIFTTVGMEPWGRYLVGVFELIASVLLLINTTAWVGGALALGLMTGAIGMHITLLGIEVQDDGGLLFFYAVLVAVCAVVVLWINRATVSAIVKGITGRP
ncbi:MAG: DoxX family protein [Cyclobacteriaceae bacterium]|nr:DoxX family protein [Cyclobacteriaceae bacterium]